VPQNPALRFAAKVHKLGINPCVDIPGEIATELWRQAGKQSGPLRGDLNGAKFQTTAVKYRGKWRLYLNTNMRTRSGIETGDEVAVELAFDFNPPEFAMPEKLAQALAQNTNAKNAFEQLIPSRQKDIIRYLNSLKTEESLDRNIKKVMKAVLK
jgi:hypothetical protein